MNMAGVFFIPSTRPFLSGRLGGGDGISENGMYGNYGNYCVTIRYRYLFFQSLRTAECVEENALSIRYRKSPSWRYLRFHVSRLNIVYPMLFKLSNKKQNRTTHCGVLEFVADEGRIYIPYWMMQNLMLDEGGLIQV